MAEEYANNIPCIPPHLANLIDAKVYASCMATVRYAMQGSFCAESHNFKDIYQHCWLIILEKWVNKRPAPIEHCGFILKIAKNLCYQLLRKHKWLSQEALDNLVNKLKAEGEYEPNLLLEHYSEIFDSLREHYGLEKVYTPLSPSEAERLAILRENLAEMDGQIWRVLWLKHYCDYSYKEIAHILNVQVEYVGVLMHRSHERLRQNTSTEPSL